MNKIYVSTNFVFIPLSTGLFICVNNGVINSTQTWTKEQIDMLCPNWIESESFSSIVEG